MNFSAYLRDRAAYIVAYVAFAFLTVAHRDCGVPAWQDSV